MALLSRQHGSITAVHLPNRGWPQYPILQGKERTFSTFLTPDFTSHPTWPSIILVPGKGYQDLSKKNQNESVFLCCSGCAPPHTHSTGIFVASHNCLVERILWLFPRWLSPHLDDVPPVNINFVMSVTPTGLQVWWNHRECLAPCIPDLLETTLLVKARHGQGSLKSLAEPLTPTGFFLNYFIYEEAIAWHSVPALFTKSETQTKL